MSKKNINNLRNKVNNKNDSDDSILYVLIFLFSALIIYSIFSANASTKANTDTQTSYTKTSLTNLKNNNTSVEKLSYPEQTTYSGSDTIQINNKNLKLTLYPKAHYKNYAMVVGKEKYYMGWESQIAQYDLALAWNKLMIPEYQKGISYSQGNRWYFYRYNSNFIGTANDIIRNSSNHHIIPANKNILNGISKIRVKDKIYLEGYLVYIKGTYNGSQVWWNSSLSRNDTGNGACEVFYVTKAYIQNKLYQ